MSDILMGIPFVNMFYFLVTAMLLKSVFKRLMKYLDKKENKKLIENFVHIHAILTFHMDASYETIHKDNILVYSLDGLKPNEENIDDLCREFVKLTMKLAGSNMTDLFTELYGGDENMFFVMMDYFNRRFEDDEIRAQAIENIQDGDEDTI